MGDSHPFQPRFWTAYGAKQASVTEMDAPQHSCSHPPSLLCSGAPPPRYREAFWVDYKFRPGPTMLGLKAVADQGSHDRLAPNSPAPLSKEQPTSPSRSPSPSGSSLPPLPPSSPPPSSRAQPASTAATLKTTRPARRKKATTAKKDAKKAARCPRPRGCQCPGCERRKVQGRARTRRWRAKNARSPKLVHSHSNTASRTCPRRAPGG
jgi:hypothetical protein